MSTLSTAAILVGVTQLLVHGWSRHLWTTAHHPQHQGDDPVTSRHRADRPCPVCHAKHPHHADEKRTVHICQTHRGRHLHEVEPGRWRLFDHVQEAGR